MQSEKMHLHPVVNGQLLIFLVCTATNLLTAFILTVDDLCSSTDECSLLTLQKGVLLREEETSSAARHQHEELQQPEPVRAVTTLKPVCE